MPRIKKFLSPTIFPLDQDITKQWYIKYTNPSTGELVKVYGKMNTLPTLEEKLAEAKRILTEDLAHVEAIPKAAAKTELLRHLQQVFEYQCVNLKPKSIVSYRGFFEEFSKWYRLHWRSADTQLMGFEYITYLKQKKGVSATTINNYRAFLKSMFIRMMDLKLYSHNPFAVTKKLKEHRSTNEWFRKEQIAKLKRVIELNDPQLWLSCRIQFYCFIRPGAELLYLQLQDIQITEKRIRIRAGIGKSATQDEYVPIPDLMIQELEAFTLKSPGYYYLFGANQQPGLHPLSKAVLYRRHKVFLENLNFPEGYTFYSWKNSGAVHMLLNNVSIHHISKLMRHRSLDYTREYFKSLGFDDMAMDLNSKYPLL